MNTEKENENDVENWTQAVIGEACKHSQEFVLSM
jgi:hypothetical protein